MAVSTAALVALFTLAARASEQAQVQRHTLAAEEQRIVSAQRLFDRAAQLQARAVAERDPNLSRSSLSGAGAAVPPLVAIAPGLGRAGAERLRDLRTAQSAADRRDWSGAEAALLRVAADGRLREGLSSALAQRRARWERADARTGLTDSRSARFVRAVTLAGATLVLAAALLGAVAAHALSQQTRARRRSEQDAERAEALEAAVQARTADLLEANAHLEREMAERSAAEAQLRQGQKMEAIGQLTGGIAHDFNNMLAVVVGGIELARRRIDQPREVARHLDRAMEGSDRAVALTRRLLSFSRAEPANAEALSLNTLVTGLADLLERSLGERIAVALDLVDGLWPVRVDRNQMENAILNLAVNARDAMSPGGTLRIATANRAGGVPRVELSVTDTGAGMDEQTRDRAMEPFFTTKAAGHGTGLGLSQVFGLVRAAGGEMWIDSAVGHGTTVRLALPAVDAEPKRAEPIAPTASSAVHDRRTVLVVEDDSRVRRATVSALEELGHRTLACSDGAAALALLRGGTQVDLLVSDVVMPGLSGPALAAELEAGGRDVPILFVTGYAAAEGADRLTRHEVLRKPFTIVQLNDAIARTLERVARQPARSAG